MKYNSENIKQYEKQIIEVTYTASVKNILRTHTRVGTLSKIFEDHIELNFFGFLYNSTIKFENVVDVKLLSVFLP